VKYKAVLFDFDGTLIDTLEDIAHSVNSALKKIGFPQYELEDYRSFVGDGREALTSRVLPEQYRNPDTIDKVLAYINEEYDRRWADNSRPYPGIPEMLDEINNRDIKMAILSNKANSFIEIMTARLLPHWRFAVVMGAMPTVPLKPDPTSALQVATQMGLDPAEIIYLGDSDIDMITAGKAGMYPVGALWGYRDAGNLLAGGAKALIKKPVDLLLYL